MSDGQLEAKFRAVTSDSTTPERAQALIKSTWSLDQTAQAFETIALASVE